MPRRYRPGEVIRVLERLGWRVVRQRGSHVRPELPDGRNPVRFRRLAERLTPRRWPLSYVKREGIRQFVNVAEEIL